MRRIILAVIVFLSAFSANATHIIGGYMSYRFISGTTYEVKLTVYRDCSVSTGFDNPAAVGLYNASTNTLVQSLSFYTPVITRIQSPNDPCLQITNIACVEQAVYTVTLTLPSATTPYLIVHQRCCRNSTITNITNPGAVGETFSAYIPATTPLQNSSPTYNNLPPIYVCVNLPLSYDHSATDIDGDELRYSLCAPYTGASALNPAPSTPSAPPYTNVNWRAPYSASNPMGGVPLTIDSLTGELTGRPSTVGQFVVGVCVSEYRNGQLIGTYLRDFQFNVTQCNVPIASIPTTGTDPSTGVGIYSSECKNFTINFKNNSFNPPPTTIGLDYQWDFGVPGIDSDTSTLSFPSYTYTDTGIYKVRLVIRKGGGASFCTDTTYALVRIFPTLTVDFQTKDTCANVATPFLDLSQTSYGTLANWNWSFGDGGTSTLQNPTHAYASSGTYNVRLVTETSVGCRDTMLKQINIYVTASADFTFDTVCLGQPTHFNTASGANNYSWDFGSGVTSSNQNPTHIYTASGNNPVSLVTVSTNGCKDSVSKIVPVNPLPVINATGDTTVCFDSPVQLFATGGVSYVWTPSAGLSDSSIANPTVTIITSTPTSYTVSVTDVNQCSNQKSLTISVRPPVDAGPDAAICSSPTFPGENTQLQAIGGVSYQWSPATGLSSTSIADPVANPLVPHFTR
ncbi:MAG: PKD domain-containing protein [Bacteroidetes bacterium]|nr:PKD domain-containing protein [Bacteroidota bacterium]